MIPQVQILSPSPMDIKVKDGEPCPNTGCRHHVTHPCELCGRMGARGETTVRWGCLRIRKEELEDAGGVEH